MSEEHVTDWWEVFRELAPWGMLLFLVMFDGWIIRRLRRRNHELRCGLGRRPGARR